MLHVKLLEEEFVESLSSEEFEAGPPSGRDRSLWMPQSLAESIGRSVEAGGGVGDGRLGVGDLSLGSLPFGGALRGASAVGIRFGRLYEALTLPFGGLGKAGILEEDAVIDSLHFRLPPALQTRVHRLSNDRPANGHAAFA